MKALVRIASSFEQFEQLIWGKISCTSSYSEQSLSEGYVADQAWLTHSGFHQCGLFWPALPLCPNVRTLHSRLWISAISLLTHAFCQYPDHTNTYDKTVCVYIIKKMYCLLCIPWGYIITSIRMCCAVWRAVGHMAVVCCLVRLQHTLLPAQIVIKLSKSPSYHDYGGDITTLSAWVTFLQGPCNDFPLQMFLNVWAHQNECL